MQKLELKNRKGQKIVGVLETPEGDSFGTCIIQHGYGGFKEQPSIQSMKTAFLHKGFQAFIFDTTNSFGESDGKFEDARLGLHAEDLEDVISWAKKQEWFKRPLALVGTSMGGYSVLSYAEKNPKEVSCCIAHAPVVSGKFLREGKEEREPGILKKWEESGWHETESVSKPGFIRRSPWDVMVEYMNHDLLLNTNALTMPVLIIGGTKDTSVLVKHLQILFNAIPEGNKEIKVVEDLPHTPRKEKELDDLRKVIEEWIDSNLIVK
ncbi:MAG TPA: alpha/beta fold hydrolase [Candidatus Paceibacterota bacterium]|nr:alpha/beta fold hydrolase [Candidatus Paceibacterota bacterium]